jgi:hypothetical protein
MKIIWIKYKDFNRNTCWAANVSKPFDGYVRVVPFLYDGEKRYSIGPSDKGLVTEEEEAIVFDDEIEAFEYLEFKFK